MKRTLAAAAMALSAGAAHAADDRAIIAALDVRYQAAVKANDAETMAKILHPQMILVVGSGAVVTRDDLLKEARAKSIVYEIQDEEPGSQTVRMFGADTAVVTAKLRLKYVTAGKASDRTLWFSDTYVRTPDGWRYAFGQASLALPTA
ncbi:MAG: nuclear transport factor 2 family protein [Alphaproteobacteria bacterium]|nr:nuclear transport factor 2 family protein [Alphaproteobacteria bacterium]MBU1515903.1 nuclear transport factor 2 family protein [Alphaproteobacteria bacterium]MBU2094125.1 nuclear transport factor 2 family protein [Alphaproteobacteria bacterium]MBU2151477.1 nuclear transport factor 2 family protein [Alphaproteobacteria bacterium]MBU2305247.1 nuclear transport factor 2 family protein [Alphaproteobacteria bacterium]